VANNLASVTPKLLAQAMMSLRELAVMPQLVNRQYDAIAGQKGSSIDVPIPSAITAAAVTAAATPPATTDFTPNAVNILLDQWFKADFELTDKDMLEAMNGTIPMQAQEAVKAIANNVDSFILGKYKGVYSYSGTAGTTPFASDISAYTTARTNLNKTVAPPRDRRVVLDPLAEGAAVALPLFIQAQQRGDQQGILEGTIGHKVGADWYMDQNVPTQTAGVPGGTPVCAAGNVAGQTNAGTTPQGGITATGFVNLTGLTTSTGTYNAGDIITIGSTDLQTYAVLANATANAGGSVQLAIAPALKLSPATSATVALKASHTVNMLFHRDAFAFASRPLVGSAEGLGNIIQSAVDPVSGLTLRLEISRQYKRTNFCFDMLYGAQLIRAELASRIAG
jgi:hypothetical protein